MTREAGALLCLVGACSCLAWLSVRWSVLALGRARPNALLPRLSIALSISAFGGLLAGLSTEWGFDPETETLVAKIALLAFAGIIVGFSLREDGDLGITASCSIFAGSLGGLIYALVSDTASPHLADFGFGTLLVGGVASLAGGLGALSGGEGLAGLSSPDGKDASSLRELGPGLYPTRRADADQAAPIAEVAKALRKPVDVPGWPEGAAAQVAAGHSGLCTFCREEKWSDEAGDDLAAITCPSCAHTFHARDYSSYRWMCPNHRCRKPLGASGRARAV